MKERVVRERYYENYLFFFCKWFLFQIVPVIPGGSNIPLTFSNRSHYFEQVIKYRLQEFDLQVAAVREGMAGIIPVPLLSLVTSDHIEQLVCGTSHISINLLKRIVR